MSRALTTGARYLAWAPPTTGMLEDDLALSRCLEAASLLAEAWTNCALLRAEWTAYHSGSLAVRFRCGDSSQLARTTLYLADPNTGRALRRVVEVSAVTEDGDDITPYLMVQEDGTLPTFADGDAALFYEDGRVRRVSITDGVIAEQEWSDGLANIVIAVTAGFNVAGSADWPCPEDLEYVVFEATQLLLKEGARGGLESLAESGANLTFVRLLSPLARRILDQYRMGDAPRTIER